MRDSRYAPSGSEESIAACRNLNVGDRVRFDGESQARFKVQARDERFVVLTKPFNARRTVVYTVIDLELGIRGTDDFGGLGYETPEECEGSLAAFSDPDMEARISVRNNVRLDVADVKAAARG